MGTPRYAVLFWKRVQAILELHLVICRILHPKVAGLDMTDVDLSTAENSYVALLDAREKPREVAADLVRVLRTKTQNSGKRPPELEIVQADAWLAICALSKSLDTDYQTSSEAWSRAISRTEEWRNLLD
jgi:hypothetical protein